MNKDELERLENKYAHKMIKAMSPYIRDNHDECDEVLKELLKELSMTRTLELYETQCKWCNYGKENNKN